MHESFRPNQPHLGEPSGYDKARNGSASGESSTMMDERLSSLGDMAIGHSAPVERQGTYDDLFRVDEELEAKLASMSEAERKRYEMEQIQSAAVRRPGLQELILAINKDLAGMHRPDADQSKAIVEALSALGGVSEEQPSSESVNEGINRAKRLVESDQAKSVLRRLPFTDGDELILLRDNAKRITMTLDGSTLTVPASSIVGAGGFKSWLGRGDEGSGGVAADRQEIKATIASVDKVLDYATRDTELPIVNDVELYVTEKGVFAYARNSHRAGAAKLRNESLRASSFKLYDLRNAVNPDVTRRIESIMDAQHKAYPMNASGEEAQAA